jgi:ketosteroid isomerase-like protein
MSAENVQLVREGYEAFSLHGEDAILEYLHPDCEVTPAQEVPGSRTYRGHDGFRQYLADTRDVFGEFGWEATELIDVGESVVARTPFFAEGRESGVPVEATLFIVWTMRDGMAVSSRGYLDRETALEVAASSP